MRFCPKCSQNLDEEQFNWKVTGVKRSVYCRNCSRKYIREHYHRNKKYYIDKAKTRNQKLFDIAHAIIGRYLETHPCVDCGENNILVLEFDHRDRTKKDNDVSSLVRRYSSVERLVIEMKKCDVRCANCHRIKTEKERNSWKLKYAPIAQLD